MPQIVRFGVSLEKELLAKFDQRRKNKNHANRSEAVRDLIREDLVKAEWTAGKEVAGAVTLVYDHHRRELVAKLMDIQHDFGDMIISSQHVHLDHHHCLEIIALKGKAERARMLCDRLTGVKGVKHGTLSMTTTGKHV